MSESPPTDLTKLVPPDAPHVQVRPRDQGHAAPRWEFDDEVTRVFEDMLWRSIPSYTVMRDLCTSIAKRHLHRDGIVLDLGCSRGGAIAALLPHSPGGKFYGVEVSAPMIAAARERFRAEPRVSIDEVDLRLDFPQLRSGSACVVMAVLTLQFIPIEHRARVVARAAEVLHPGAVMIVVEKILGSNAWADDLLVADYYDFKRANGYTQDDIDRKRLALEGVLVPQTEGANIEMLKANGFRNVEPFWRHLNFCGWIAMK